MPNRVGQVWHWGPDDDIVLILKFANGWDQVDWEAVSLLDAKIQWFSEVWFSKGDNEYVKRIA